MNDDQLKAYKDKHGSAILHFPTVLGAVVRLTTFQDNTLLNFTPEAVGIFWDAFPNE